MPSTTFRRFFSGVAIAVCCQIALKGQQRPPVVFGQRVVFVPVDLRATDDRGNVVDDLRPTELTILEDGKPQAIELFKQPGVARQQSSAAVEGARASGDGAPPESRTFMIVLGRGRLEHPSMGLTAIRDFVQSKLKPLDRIGVLAYDRVSDPTTQHAAVASLLQRYQAQYELIEARFDNQLSGIAEAFWDGVTPENIERLIDDLFRADGIPPSRRLPMLIPPTDLATNEDREQIVRDINLFRHDVKAWQDLGHLHTAVELLRDLPGEKHVVYLTEQPVRLTPKAAGRLAQFAADARVTISTIQTGGSPGKGFDLRSPGGEFKGRTFGELMNLETFRSLTHDTGGEFSVYEYSVEALSRIDRSTASSYQLGYYPASVTSDNKFHRIEVRTTRPGVTLSYRRGYFASVEQPSAALRARKSSSRTAAALDDPHSFGDIPVAVVVRATGGQLNADITIDPTTLHFEEREGAKTAALEIAIKIRRQGKTVLEEQRQTVDVTVPLSAMPTADTPLHRTITISTKGNLRGELKVVVYDYAADRLGTATTTIR